MKVISVNVGKPQKCTLDDVTIETSMIRHPVSQIQINKTQVEGDQFASPEFHGTNDAVVYALSADRYPDWEKFLSKPFPLGSLGENLSIDLLREEDFYLGDEYQVGTAVLRATGPRYPCNKLNYSSGDKRLQREFESRDWCGIYFEVVKEGTAQSGDELKLIKRHQDKVTVLDLYKAMRAKRKSLRDDAKAELILACDQLLEKYRKKV
jgi:MOSC domain-containing protein YiiM